MIRRTQCYPNGTEAGLSEYQRPDVRLRRGGCRGPLVSMLDSSGCAGAPVQSGKDGASCLCQRHWQRFPVSSAVATRTGDSRRIAAQPSGASKRSTRRAGALLGLPSRDHSWTLMLSQWRGMVVPCDPPETSPPCDHVCGVSLDSPCPVHAPLAPVAPTSGAVLCAGDLSTSLRRPQAAALELLPAPARARIRLWRQSATQSRVHGAAAGVAAG